MTRLFLLLCMATIINPVNAGEPLIDGHQMKAVEANEKLESDCEKEFREKQDMKCKYYLAQGDNRWPIPLRGTDRYCKEAYASLSVEELEVEFKKIEAVYEQARFFPVGSAIEPERGEVTKGDLNSEIRCISDFIELKK